MVQQPAKGTKKGRGPAEGGRGRKNPKEVDETIVTRDLPGFEGHEIRR